MDLPENLKLVFIDWLEDEISKLTLRQHKLGMTYSRALDNLKEYEGRLSTTNDLTKVRYFGPKLIINFTKRLHMYCLENGYKFPTGDGDASTSKSKKRKKDDNSATETAKKKAKPAYVPRKNSGGYAILLVLLEFDRDENGLTRETIASKATPYCSTSFENNPAANQLHSAWSSMKTLNNHELVKSRGRPIKYFLTEEGKLLAQKLKESDKIVFRNEKPKRLIESERPTSRSSISSSPNRRVFDFEGDNYCFWDAGSYELVFIIDNREIRAQNQRDFFLNKLTQVGVKAETRALTVGDGLWIARHKSSREEVVLNYIIERKRLDDLTSSIKDGRYNEQKFRLKRTGVGNVFYLIEEMISVELQNMADAIQTSMSMAMTNSNFHCIRTKDADSTIQFIEKTTKELIKFYRNKRLLVIDPNTLQQQKDYAELLEKFKAKFNSNQFECTHYYSTFDTMLSKSDLTTTREMFVRMLMTIRGISLEKAIAIQKEFKTPRLLIQKFDKNDQTLASKYGKKVQESIADVFQNNL